jgi:photosystem II stability/assembly factor-like uncharacterized protein
MQYYDSFQGCKSRETIMNLLITRRDFSRTVLAGATMIALPAFAADASIWVKQPTVPFKGKQDDISFVDPDHGWYGNGEGKLYRTTNGGASWDKVWDKPGTFIRALGFVDRQTGYLGNVGTDYYPGVTDKNPLYRTRDGGATWEAIAAPGIEKVAGICGIHILPVKRIYQGELRTSHVIHAAGRVGGPAMMLRSEDGGDSWKVIDLTAHAGMILDVFFQNAKVGFVAASSPSDTGEGEAMILRTINGGANWDIVYKSGRKAENCWKMSWPSTKTGYATVQSYDDDPAKTKRVIIKTVNGGASWKELLLVNDKTAQEFGIGFADDQRGWVGTRIGGFETRDGGKTWNQIEFGKAVNKIRILPKPISGHFAMAIGVDVHRLDF